MVSVAQSHVQQLAERELQSHGEEEEDDAYVGPYLDVRGIGDGGKETDCGSRDEACHDVAQDDRLFEPLEQDRDAACHDQYRAQIGN